MELHPLVLIEWREDHALSRRSLIWIHQNADPGDPHPIVTALRQLRAGTAVPTLPEVAPGPVGLV